MIVVRWLDANFERFMIAMLLAAIVLLIFANVFMRYVLNDSLSWGEELTLWLFVWFVWLSVSYAFQKNEHVRITAFHGVLGPRGQKALDVVVDLLILAFFAILIVECIKLILLPFVASQTSVVLGIPIPVLYASAPIGAALSCFRVIQHLIKTLRAPAHQNLRSS